jgi:hypothetical protein
MAIAINIATALPGGVREPALCLDLGLHLTLDTLLVDLIVFELKRVHQLNE